MIFTFVLHIKIGNLGYNIFIVRYRVNWERKKLVRCPFMNIHTQNFLLNVVHVILPKYILYVSIYIDMNFTFENLRWYVYLT